MAGCGLLHHDLIFSYPAMVYAPDRIVVKSNDCCWNALSLTGLFADSMVAEFRDPAIDQCLFNEYLGGSIDMVFIDGVHTNGQQALDYGAIKPLMSFRGGYPC